jgi:flagellar biosynthesis protein FlhG
MARVLTVTSGKGGVGKTNICANLAIQLARQGFRTCLFDADLGLANVNILLKLYPEYNLEDVLFGNKCIDDIVINNHHGIDIIPGSSGVAKLADLDQKQIKQLIASFSKLQQYDYILFDTSAGISRNVISFCMAASQIILVITPEPTSLTDAYALLKVLSLNGHTEEVLVVVNQTKNVRIAKLAYNKLKDTVQKFLPINITPLGTVLKDAQVTEAVKEQEPFLLKAPQSLASRCIQSLTKQLLAKPSVQAGDLALDDFWVKCLDVFQGPLRLSNRKDAEKHKPLPEKDPDEITSGPKLPPADTSSEHSKKNVPAADEAYGDKGLAFVLKEAFAQLSGSVDSVARELAAIKKELVKNDPTPTHQPDIPHGPGANTPTIALDFNAYLHRQNKNK